jgi:hypothetical protein
MNGNKYDKQKIIPLENMKLENLAVDNDPKNGWLIKTPAKCFAVFARLFIKKRSEWNT